MCTHCFDGTLPSVYILTSNSHFPVVVVIVLRDDEFNPSVPNSHKDALNWTS